MFSLGQGYRFCSVCKEKIEEGFVIDGGDKYACSEECLHQIVSPEEYLELYDDGEGDTYWTTWYDECLRLYVS